MKSDDTKKLRVLHFTPWYPNDDNPYEATWIRRHVDSIQARVDQYVFHIDVSQGKRIMLRRSKMAGSERIILKLPTSKWIVFELCWFFILFFLLVVKKVARKGDVLQFHIAYPSLVFWRWLKPFVKTPAIILEHWSGYHFNFGVTNARKLKRVKKIFSHHLPVVSVSRALSEDLRTFSGRSDFDLYILPNIVDTRVFFFDETVTTRPDGQIFMLSQWKWPKEPLIILQAFTRWNAAHKGRFILKIGGYGHQMPAIAEMVQQPGLKDSAVILGQMSPLQVAEEMRRSMCFAHCSGYETFSVVCAEALACGTPVLASNVGGIAEFVHEENGVLVEENTVEAWCRGFEKMRVKKFDRYSIGKEATGRFSSGAIGEAYYRILKAVDCEAV